MAALRLRDPVTAVPGETAPVVWVLHDGKPGMASQALGLAEATGFPFIERQLSIRAPWAWLPPQFWLEALRAVSTEAGPLQPPWPDLVIGCGRLSAMPALAIRRLAEARRRFPRFAGLPRPILGVLIGGANRSYRLSLDRLAAIAEAIAGVLRAGGGSALVTPSRRTGAAGVALLRERLAGLPAEIWDGSGDNPYYAYLAAADALLVTADSVSMISEAAATGKPVHILELAKNRWGGDGKFARFHATMREAGITRPFTGEIESWSYSPLDDTARAGKLLRGQVLARLAQRRYA